MSLSVHVSAGSHTRLSFPVYISRVFIFSSVDAPVLASLCRPPPSFTHPLSPFPSLSLSPPSHLSPLHLESAEARSPAVPSSSQELGRASTGLRRGPRSGSPLCPLSSSTFPRLPQELFKEGTFRPNFKRSFRLALRMVCSRGCGREIKRKKAALRSTLTGVPPAGIVPRAHRTPRPAGTRGLRRQERKEGEGKEEEETPTTLLSQEGK